MALNLLFVEALPLVLYGIIVFQVHVGLSVFHILQHVHQTRRDDDAHASVEPLGVDTDEAEVDDIGLFQGFEQLD